MSSIPAAAPRTVLGHPPGLAILFFAEMWERFSFYGMRALLILYLTKHWLFGDTVSTGIYAAYGSLVYLAPVIGGFLADRLLGFRKAVVFGAILLVCGHAGMAIEGEQARVVADEVVRDEAALQVFYFSLAFIIMGVGFLKSSISNIVGQLYDKDEDTSRRDAGFTIFYMGINVGAMTSALICGWLGETYGWAYGFGLAGIGMFIGLVTFVWGRPLLEGAGEPSNPEYLAEKALFGLSREWLTYIGGLFGVVIAWALIQNTGVVSNLMYVAAGIVGAGVVYYSLKKCTVVERGRLLVVLFLTAVSVVFWALFEQAGSSMNLFAARNITLPSISLFGWDWNLKASQLQSLNPAFIIMLAPLFSMFWIGLARHHWEPSIPTKFGLGVLQVGLGFGVLVLGCQQADSAGQVAVIWIVLAYLLHTTGELCLSPIGLSAVTSLSPVRVVGTMMGVWFFSSAFAHTVAGIIAQTASVSEVPGSVIDPVQSLAIYSETFEFLLIAGCVVGVAVLAVSPLMKRAMHLELPRGAS